MIPALTVALSIPGCWLAWALLRPMPGLARDLPITPDDPDVVQFGVDGVGLVD